MGPKTTLFRQSLNTTPKWQSIALHTCLLCVVLPAGLPQLPLISSVMQFRKPLYFIDCRVIRKFRICVLWIIWECHWFDLDFYAWMCVLWGLQWDLLPYDNNVGVSSATQLRLDLIQIKVLDSKLRFLYKMDGFVFDEWSSGVNFPPHSCEPSPPKPMRVIFSSHSEEAWEDAKITQHQDSINLRFKILETLAETMASNKVEMSLGK